MRRAPALFFGLFLAAPAGSAGADTLPASRVHANPADLVTR
jgi:hypothetical protein